MGDELDFELIEEALKTELAQAKQVLRDVFKIHIPALVDVDASSYGFGDPRARVDSAIEKLRQATDRYDLVVKQLKAVRNRRLVSTSIAVAEHFGD